MKKNIFIVAIILCALSIYTTTNAQRLQEWFRIKIRWFNQRINIKTFYQSDHRLRRYS
jgi:hypothetical protein